MNASDIGVSVLMDRDQLEAYRQLIAVVPDGSWIVELGVYQGGSLIENAELIKVKRLNVMAVDLFENTEYKEPETISPLHRDAALRTFHQNVKKAGLNPLTICGTSYEVAKLLKCFYEFVMPKLIFIDADHSYEWAKKDIENLWPWVAPGGYLAGHDFNLLGVRKAVVEKFGELTFPTNIWSIRKDEK